MNLVLLIIRADEMDFASFPPPPPPPPPHPKQAKKNKRKKKEEKGLCPYRVIKGVMFPREPASYMRIL